MRRHGYHHRRRQGRNKWRWINWRVRVDDNSLRNGRHLQTLHDPCFGAWLDPQSDHHAGEPLEIKPENDGSRGQRKEHVAAHTVRHRRRQEPSIRGGRNHRHAGQHAAGAVGDLAPNHTLNCLGGSDRRANDEEGNRCGGERRGW